MMLSFWTPHQQVPRPCTKLIFIIFYSFFLRSPPCPEIYKFQAPQKPLNLRTHLFLFFLLLFLVLWKHKLHEGRDLCLFKKTVLLLGSTTGATHSGKSINVAVCVCQSQVHTSFRVSHFSWVKDWPPSHTRKALLSVCSQMC